MGNKFERTSIVTFMILTVLIGAFIAFSWGIAIIAYNIDQFNINDNLIVLNGIIESINYNSGNEDLFLKISGKVYNIETFFPALMGTDGRSLELFYYTIEIGDNLTIYESGKIVLNEVVYREAVFEDYSWFAWVITSIPVIIIATLLIVAWVFVGSEKEIQEKEMKKIERKNNDLRADLRRANEQYTRWKTEYVQKTEKQKNPNAIFNPLRSYCNNCGSEVDVNDTHCEYCGTEVRLE